MSGKWAYVKGAKCCTSNSELLWYQCWERVLCSVSPELNESISCVQRIIALVKGNWIPFIQFEKLKVTNKSIMVKISFLVYFCWQIVTKLMRSELKSVIVVCWVNAGSFVDDNIIFRWIAYTWFLRYIVE